MTKDPRDTSVRSGTIGYAVRLALWAKTAGRCTICNRRMLGDQRTYWHSTLAAQAAHNVGATDTPGSPRGGEKVVDREAEENLLLVCHDCHKVIDSKDHFEAFTTDRLRNIKREHELRVERATDFGGLTRTAAIRLFSEGLRGSPAFASSRDVAETLLNNNYLGLVESRWSGDFTCVLTGDDTGERFWSAAMHSIDDTIERVQQAAQRGDVEHVSVFAIAPIPALVYLGSKLDDNLKAKVYQRHRTNTPAWDWPRTSSEASFAHSASNVTPDAEDVVIAVSLTAPVNLTRIPTGLLDAPVFALGPDTGSEHSPDVIDSSDALDAFRAAFQRLLADVEAQCPAAKTWHLIAATPVSPAIVMGSSFMRSAQPPVAVYQRQDESYYRALDVNQ